jgi:hypothetical protein
MTLRIGALSAFAVLLLGTPARADELAFTPASPGVDFSVNDGPFWVSSSGIVKTDASASILGSDFHLSAIGTSYSDAGIVLFFDGGLVAGALESVTVATDNPEAISVNIWLDTGGDGRFFAFDGSGAITGLNGDSYGSFGNTTQVASTSWYEPLGGSVAGMTLADLRAAYPNTSAALWIGITNSNTADISSVTVEVSPEPASWWLIGTGLIGLGGILRRRSLW